MSEANLANFLDPIARVWGNLLQQGLEPRKDTQGKSKKQVTSKPVSLLVSIEGEQPKT